MNPDLVWIILKVCFAVFLIIFIPTIVYWFYLKFANKDNDIVDR